MIVLPDTTRYWRQTNRSDVLGTLLGSFNLDLYSNLGRTRGTRMLSTTLEMNDVPVGFKFYNGAVWTIAGSFAYSNSGLTYGSFIADATAGHPTNLSAAYSDIETFNGSMYVTGGSSLYKNNLGTWSTNGTGIGSAMPHMLTAYSGTSRLYISNGNSVYSMDTSDTITKTSTYTCTLASDLVVTFMRTTASRIFIGTVNTNNGKGYIYEWDGTSVSPQVEHRLQSSGALAGVVRDDVLYAMDANGRLLVWQGGTFIEVGRLPIDDKFLNYTNYFQNIRFIHPNGMSVVNGRVLALINNVNYGIAATIQEFCPSGIWELDDNVGLYHRYSLSITQKSDPTISDYGQNRISAAGALADMRILDNSATATGTFIAGGTVYTTATVTSSGTFVNDTLDTTQKCSNFVTTKIEADDASVYHLPSIENTWNSIYTTYKQFLTATDKIVLKYRLVEATFTEAPITWVDSTHFTVLNSDVDIRNYWTSGIGGEVEITRGTGGGMCAHIIGATLNAGTTWTVMVDETFTGVSGTATARFQNWKKVGAMTKNNQNFNSDTIGDKSNWVELKYMMLFTGPNELNRIVINNINSQPPK